MDEGLNPLKSRCARILTTEHKYRQGEIIYLTDMMKQLDQEILEEYLKTLNYHELKIAHQAGVPGHCNFIANELLYDFKEKIDAYIHSTK